AAWRARGAAAEPWLATVAARPDVTGRLAREVDANRDIAVAVMTRLQASSFRRLRVYLAAKRENPQLRFVAWLHVVARRVAIDYVRARPEYARGERRWRETEPLSSTVGERPPMTDR